MAQNFFCHGAAYSCHNMMSEEFLIHNYLIEMKILHGLLQTGYSWTSLALVVWVDLSPSLLSFSALCCQILSVLPCPSTLAGIKITHQAQRVIIWSRHIFNHLMLLIPTVCHPLKVWGRITHIEKRQSDNDTMWFHRLFNPNQSICIITTIWIGKSSRLNNDTPLVMAL